MRTVIFLTLSALCLAGCATSPQVHFHTLSEAASSDAVTRVQPDLQYQIAAVNVPERLDRADMVVQGGKIGEAGVLVAEPETSVVLLENERWDASFADALRDALSTRLALAAAATVTDMRKQPLSLRLTLQVYRFDAHRAGYVDVLADWRLRRLDDESGDGERSRIFGGDRAVLNGRYQGRADVRAGDIDGLVAGMQQQVARMAGDIVASTRAWLGNTARRGCMSGADTW